VWISGPPVQAVDLASSPSSRSNTFWTEATGAANLSGIHQGSTLYQSTVEIVAGDAALPASGHLIESTTSGNSSSAGVMRGARKGLGGRYLQAFGGREQAFSSSVFASNGITKRRADAGLRRRTVPA